MIPSRGMEPGTAFEHETLYANADTLRRSIVDRLPDWDRRRALDREAMVEAAALGLTGIEVPKYLGGLGLGFRQKVKAAEILSRSSMAFAFSVINSQNVAARLAEIGTTNHKRELLPHLLSGSRLGSTALTEPGVGSDFGAIATTASRTGTGWVLNGEKAWITNAAVSDVIICYAQTEPGSGRNGIASFLIDGTRPGFRRGEPYRLSGGHIIGTGGFRLEDYEAPADDLLTEPGAGFASAMRGVNGARIYVAAMCCAMVRASLEIAIEYGGRRQAFGRPLLGHQGLAWSLASVANRLEAATLLTDNAIATLDSSETGDVVLAASHAKKFATEMAEPAIAACIQAMGAEGLRESHPLSRHLADARIANFVDGSTEIQTERIARSLEATYRPPTFDYPELPPPEAHEGAALDAASAAAPADRPTGVSGRGTHPPNPPLPPESLRTDRG